MWIHKHTSLIDLHVWFTNTGTTLKNKLMINFNNNILSGSCKKNASNSESLIFGWSVRLKSALMHLNVQPPNM